MDCLLSQLSDFNVSSYQNSPNSEHPLYRTMLYKYKRRGSSQEERRKKILEIRKESRYDLMKHLRNIEESDIHPDPSNEEEMNVDEPRALYQEPREYQNFVMLSEWLVDVPEDFQQNYLAILCPIGKRCLCVCYKGKSTIYAKSGKPIREFPSLLPGGCKKTQRCGYTVLDCIWSEANKTIYIIDLIFWYKNSFMECETSFRFEWLKSRIKEYDENVTVISPVNKYRFLPVPFFSCDKETLSGMFENPLLEEATLDGVLFYHKFSHYTHGPTPLVCWLKAFMLPEILGVEIPPRLMEEKPKHYVDISSHIVEFNELRKKRTQKKQGASGKDKMES